MEIKREIRGVKSVDEILKDLEVPIRPLSSEPPPLPEVKSITHIDGKTLEEFNRQLDAQREADSYLSPEEKMKALKKEDELLDEEQENKDRREGIIPLRLIAKYKMEIGIGTAIAAIAGFLMKC